MSLYVAGGPARILSGGVPVSRVVVAGVDVWASFQGYSASTTTSRTLTEGVWVTLDERTVGHGGARYTLDWSWNNDPLQWLAYDRQMRLLVNGDEVWKVVWNASGSWSNSATTNDLSLSYGDTVAYQAYVSGTGRSSARVLGSWSLVSTAL